MHRQYTYAPIRWSWAPVHRTQIVVIEVVRLRPRLQIITSNLMNHDHLLHGMSTILGKFVCFPTPTTPPPPHKHHHHSCSFKHHRHPHTNSPYRQNMGGTNSIHFHFISLYNVQTFTPINVSFHWLTILSCKTPSIHSTKNYLVEKSRCSFTCCCIKFQNFKLTNHTHSSMISIVNEK